MSRRRGAALAYALGSVVVGLLAPLGVVVLVALASAPSARAETAAPSLALTLTPCAKLPFSANELRGKLELYLHADGVGLAKSGEPGVFAASLDCACGPSATGGLLVLTSSSGVRIERHLDWADVSAPDRPAVIALAIAEMVRGLRAMDASAANTANTANTASNGVASGTATATASSLVVASSSAVSPGPAATATSGSTVALAPPAAVAPLDDAHTTTTSRHDARTRLGLAVAGEVLHFGVSPTLLGLRLEVVYGALRFGGSAVTATAHDELGDVSLGLFRAVASVRALSWALGGYDAAILATASLGRVNAHGSAGTHAIGGDASEIYASFGGGGALGFSPMRDVRIGLALEAGLAHGLSIRADARDVAKLQGGWIGGQLFLEGIP